MVLKRLGDLAGAYGTNLSPLSNPNPNLLGVVNPLASTATTRLSAASQTWVDQGVAALLVQKDGVDLRYGFYPTNGLSITGTIQPWAYHVTTGIWAKIGQEIDFTGYENGYINVPGTCPIVFEVVDVSFGFVDIYYDPRSANILGVNN